MIKSFAHTGFVVSNLAKSIAFYTDVIGLSLIRETENSSEALAQVVGYNKAHVKIASLNLGNGHQLGLVEYVEPSSLHINIEPKNICAAHLAFFVEDISLGEMRLATGGVRAFMHKTRMETGSSLLKSWLVCPSF